MLRFKFGAWAVVLMLAALSFGACSDEDDDPAFNPPSNITEALKQLYPAAQNIEWEMKDVYYVADCWVADDELEVWFDGNANWLMTENYALCPSRQRRFLRCLSFPLSCRRYFLVLQRLLRI